MEIPDLVRDRLGGENIVAGVNLGDEDALCLTPSKTIVYKGEGLLSDESVSEYPHDVERLVVSKGRRKTKFQCHYVDGTRAFSVPSNRDETVLELLLGGILRVADVADEDETVEGVYRFSELTLIITEKRLVKHIGTSVWDEDYEEFAFEDVTGLTFEEGSVATQIVLGVDGRPSRIKAPNDKAPLVRRTLENALYAFHDVESLEELNELLGPDDEEPTTSAADRGAGFGLEDDIDPLVGGSNEDTDVGDDLGGDVGGVEGVEELEQPSTADASAEDEEGLRPSSMDVDPTDSDAASDGSGAESAADASGGEGSQADAAASDHRGGEDSSAPGEREADDGTDQQASDKPSASAEWPDDAEESPSSASDETPGTESNGGGNGAGETTPAEATAGETTQAEATSGEATQAEATAGEATQAEATAGEATQGDTTAGASDADETSNDPPTAASADAQLGPEEVEALESELAALREAVETQNEELREAIQSQNEVLRKQHAAIKRLIAELRED